MAPSAIHRVFARFKETEALLPVEGISVMKIRKFYTGTMKRNNNSLRFIMSSSRYVAHVFDIHALKRTPYVVLYLVEFALVLTR